MTPIVDTTSEVIQRDLWSSYPVKPMKQNLDLLTKIDLALKSSLDGGVYKKYITDTGSKAPNIFVYT